MWFIWQEAYICVIRTCVTFLAHQ